MIYCKISNYKKLIEAITFQNEAEAKQLITEINTTALSKVDKGNTALTLAIKHNLEKVCELHIEKMSERAINHVDRNGNTALIFAVDKGLGKVCELLIEKMSNEAIHNINNYGDTALTLAEKDQDLYEVYYLLTETVNKALLYNETALILVARSCAVQACELLISEVSWQNINHVTENGETALT